MKHTPSNLQIRDAIAAVLSKATHPMTSVQVAQHPDLVSLGVDTDDASRILWQMHKSKRQLHPIARIPYHGPGAPQWEYYDPNNLTPLVCASLNKKPEPEVNTVNPSEFTFNPVEFTGAGLNLPMDVKVEGAVESNEVEQLKAQPESVRIEAAGVVITITYPKESV